MIRHDPVTGWVWGPALVDLYAHSGAPGHEERESLATLAQAAQQGGYGEITILPTTTPPLDQVNQIRAVQSAYQLLETPVRINCLGALTQGCAGKTLVEAGEISPYVVGFTDNRPVHHWTQLALFMDYLHPLNRTLFIYARHPTGGIAQESATALALGLPTIADWVETTALEQLFALVRMTGVRVHIMRLATQGGVAGVRRAKQEGLPITCSVAAIQLLLTESALLSLDPLVRFDPPLGSSRDQQALITGLADGTIDAIASDHTPWTYGEKTLPFTQAPPGAVMLELALPLLWSHLVTPGHLEAQTLWRALSLNPARILHPDQTFSTHEICFDPEQEWLVHSTTLKSRSGATPWWGQRVRGRVREG